MMILVLAGCRLGNHADAPTQPNQGSIVHSELFATTVSHFKTYAYYSDNTYSSNQNANLVKVPTEILSVFTNPVYWNTYQDTEQTQFFWDNARSTLPFVTAADASGQIHAETTASSPIKLYQNPTCLTQTQTLQQGGFDRSHPTATTLAGATSASVVSGRLQLDVTRIQVFQGDCAADLQTLANCYSNGSGCDADQLSRAKLFDLYVAGTGVLNIQDATRIIGLAYIVHFE